MTKYEAIAFLISRAQHARTCHMLCPQTNAARAFGSKVKTCSCGLDTAKRIAERIASDLLPDDLDSEK